MNSWTSPDILIFYFLRCLNPFAALTAISIRFASFSVSSHREERSFVRPAGTATFINKGIIPTFLFCPKADLIADAVIVTPAV